MVVVDGNDLLKAAPQVVYPVTKVGLIINTVIYCFLCGVLYTYLR